MYQLFEILEKHDVVGPTGLGKIAKLPAREIEKLHHNLFEYVYKTQNEKMWGNQPSATDAFSFHASASLRGASGCGSPECIGRKLNILGRYAALYATEMIFPLTIRPPVSGQSISEIRDWLTHDVFALLLLRPAITENVIAPVVMRSKHCIHEMEFVKETKEIVHDFAQFAAKEATRKFKLVYQIPEMSPSSLPALYLNGPEDYIQHGGIVRDLRAPLSKLSKKRRLDKNGMIEIHGSLKKYLVRELFEELAANMTFFLAYGLKRRARFLSDMAGETEFLDLINGSEEMMAKSSALAQLEHSVPLLSDLPIATILRIRKEEKEAFESYRKAVAEISAGILTAHKRVSKKQAREMFRDSVEPELERMRKEIKTYRKVRRSQVVGGMLAMAAGIVIGAYAGLPTIAAAPIAGLGALVGGRLLGKAAEVACEHGPQFQQKNDLYFLLKLTQEV